MRMGAWSMACVLRQRIEYYYYSTNNYCKKIHTCMKKYLSGSFMLGSSDVYTQIWHLGQVKIQGYLYRGVPPYI